AGVDDARLTLERALDARLAGGAGHPRDGDANRALTRDGGSGGRRRRRLRVVDDRELACHDLFSYASAMTAPRSIDIPHMNSYRPGARGAISTRVCFTGR